MNFFHSYWKTFLLLSFFGLHLWILYGVIITYLGGKVAEKCHGSWSCRRQLAQGPFGYPIDLSDGQYREFRHYLLLFIGVAILSVILDKAYSFILPVVWPRTKYSASTLIVPKLIAGLVALFIQHKYHALIIFFLSYAGYYIPRITTNRALSAVLVWSFALFVLGLKESYRLLRYYDVPLLEILFDNRYGGLYRWQLPANFLVLRLVSYGIDYAQARQRQHAAKKEETVADSVDVNIHADNLSIEEYDSLANFFGYVLYLPLYMAGPIISYNHFIQCIQAPKTVQNPWLYALRWFACYVLMEILLTRLPLFAVVSSHLLPHLNIYEIAAVCYLMLKVMWLKFLLIWRFFRAWALFDNIDVPENMVRCMSNNYSLEQFWKGWHASYNKWLVQYIYKPLGGRKYRIFSAWLIFMFVAIWHDLEWRLIVWAGLNALFYMLEIGFKPITGYHTTRQLETMSFSETMLSSLCSAVYVLILMMVNLIGYSVGTGGASLILTKLYTTEGMYVLAFSVYILFIGVNMMFALQKWGVVKDF